MLDLAVHNGEGFIFLNDIASRQEVSVNYLGQLIPALKQAGLIESSRGAHGGYVLAREPGDIILGEIVRALEPDLSIVPCVTSPEVCHRVDRCVTHDIWSRMRESMMGVLDSVTLQQMVEEHREKLKSQHAMWYI